MSISFLLRSSDAGWLGQQCSIYSLVKEFFLIRPRAVSTFLILLEGALRRTIVVIFLARVGLKLGQNSTVSFYPSFSTEKENRKTE